MDVYVGIDVSKDSLDVHVRPTGEAFSIASDAEGVADLIERLKGLAPSLVALRRPRSGPRRITTTARAAP